MYPIDTNNNKQQSVDTTPTNAFDMHILMMPILVPLKVSTWDALNFLIYKKNNYNSHSFCILLKVLQGNNLHPIGFI